MHQLRYRYETIGGRLSFLQDERLVKKVRSNVRCFIKRSPAAENTRHVCRSRQIYNSIVRRAFNVEKWPVSKRIQAREHYPFPRSLRGRSAVRRYAVFLKQFNNSAGESNEKSGQ